MKIDKKIWFGLGAVLLTGGAYWYFTKNKSEAESGAQEESGKSTGGGGSAGGGGGSAAAPTDPIAEISSQVGKSASKMAPSPVSSISQAKRQVVPIKSISPITRPVTSNVKSPIIATVTKKTAPTQPVAKKVPAKNNLFTKVRAVVRKKADGDYSSFDNVIKDWSRGKAILKVSDKGSYKIGDTIRVNSPKYDGVYRVWMVFHKCPYYDNVYIETPYRGDDAGTLNIVNL